MFAFRRMRLPALLFPLSFVVFATAPLGAQTASSVRGAVESWVASRGPYAVPKFRQALTDLDGDGRPEAIVLLSGPDWCSSGGCQMLVFHGTTAGFEFLSATTVTSGPIRVSPVKSFGWRTLIVSSKERGDVLLPFDGAQYPSNASTAERATATQARAATVILDP